MDPTSAFGILAAVLCDRGWKFTKRSGGAIWMRLRLDFKVARSRGTKGGDTVVPLCF